VPFFVPKRIQSALFTLEMVAKKQTGTKAAKRRRVKTPTLKQGSVKVLTKSQGKRVRGGSGLGGGVICSRVTTGQS